MRDAAVDRRETGRDGSERVNAAKSQTLEVPSGVAVVIGLAHGRLARAAAAGVAVLGAMLVGISRIVLGFHYPSDVVGGFAAGAAWLAIAWLLTKPLAATGRGSEAKR